MSGLVLQTCLDCARCWTLPRCRCPTCGGANVEAREAGGAATLYASTLVRLTPDEAMKPLLPFTLALVTLAEGPRVMGHLEGEAAIGDCLQGAMAERAGRMIPVFMPATDAPATGAR